MKIILAVSLAVNVLLLLLRYLRVGDECTTEATQKKTKAQKRRDELIAQNLESGMTSYDAERSADDLLTKESREARAAFLEVHGLPADPPPPPPPTPEEVAARNRLWRDMYGSAQQDYNNRVGMGAFFR